jgi:hypothetical protein
MFLGFFGVGVLALEIGERHVQRLMRGRGRANANPFVYATWANFRIGDHLGMTSRHRPFSE